MATPLAERTRKLGDGWQAAPAAHQWGRGTRLGEAPNEQEIEERRTAEAEAATEAYRRHLSLAARNCKRQMEDAEKASDAARVAALQAAEGGLFALWKASEAFSPGRFVTEWAELRHSAVARTGAASVRVLPQELLSENEYLSPTHVVDSLAELAQSSAAASSSKTLPFFEWAGVSQKGGVPGVFFCVYLRDGSKVVRMRDVLRYFAVTEQAFVAHVARWTAENRSVRVVEPCVTEDAGVCSLANPKLHPATKFVGAVWIPRIALGLHSWYTPGMTGFAAVVQSKGAVSLPRPSSVPVAMPAKAVTALVPEKSGKAPKLKRGADADELVADLVRLHLPDAPPPRALRPVRRPILSSQIPKFEPDYLPVDPEPPTIDAAVPVPDAPAPAALLQEPSSPASAPPVEARGSKRPNEDLAPDGPAPKNRKKTKSPPSEPAPERTSRRNTTKKPVKYRQ